MEPIKGVGELVGGVGGALTMGLMNAQGDREARRMIRGGGFSINGTKIDTLSDCRDGDILRAGKHHFFRIRLIPAGPSNPDNPQ